MITPEDYLSRPVRSLQTMLQVLSAVFPSLPNVNPDGVYGPSTAEAVSAFQKSAGLPTTGLADNETWNHLAASFIRHSPKTAPPRPLRIIWQPTQTISPGEENLHLFLIQAMIADAAREAGQPTMAAFAWVVGIMQFFVGLPMTSFIISRYCRKRVAAGITVETTTEDGETKTRRKLIPPVPEKMDSSYLVVAKLLLVTVLGCWLGSLTKIPAAILCLVFGVVFCEIGFLDESSLQKSGFMSFIMLCLLASAPASFSTLSFDDFLKLVGPSVFFLLFGGVMLAVGGAIFGKLLRMDPLMGAALGLAAMYGFPFSMLIPEQVIEAMELPEAEAKALYDQIIPKMVIAGFASVTVGSVVVGAICVSQRCARASSPPPRGSPVPRKSPGRAQ